MAEADLGDRKAVVLRVLVEEYVRTGEPVGSETIAERTALGVSSATIRNEMAALEELGYLSHPHTSAGRIPTDLGYRYYVDSLPTGGKLRDTQRRAISAQSASCSAAYLNGVPGQSMSTSAAGKPRSERCTARPSSATRGSQQLVPGRSCRASL